GLAAGLNRAAGAGEGLQRVVDDQRRVVGEALVLVDRDGVRPGGDAGGGDVVIDAPAHVLGPGLAAVAPPGVLLGTLVDAAVHVHQAQLVEDAGHPGALFRQEAGILHIALPVLEVDFLVRDVPVAAD